MAAGPMMMNLAAGGGYGGMALGGPPMSPGLAGPVLGGGSGGSGYGSLLPQAPSPQQPVADDIRPPRRYSAQSPVSSRLQDMIQEADADLLKVVPPGVFDALSAGSPYTRGQSRQSSAGMMMQGGSSGPKSSAEMAVLMARLKELEEEAALLRKGLPQVSEAVVKQYLGDMDSVVMEEVALENKRLRDSLDRVTRDRDQQVQMLTSERKRYDETVQRLHQEIVTLDKQLKNAVVDNGADGANASVISGVGRGPASINSVPSTGAGGGGGGAGFTAERAKLSSQIAKLQQENARLLEQIASMESDQDRTDRKSRADSIGKIKQLEDQLRKAKARNSGILDRVAEVKQQWKTVVETLKQENHRLAVANQELAQENEALKTGTTGPAPVPAQRVPIPSPPPAVLTAASVAGASFLASESFAGMDVEEVSPGPLSSLSQRQASAPPSPPAVARPAVAPPAPPAAPAVSPPGRAAPRAPVGGANSASAAALAAAAAAAEQMERNRQRMARLAAM